METFMSFFDTLKSLGGILGNGAAPVPPAPATPSLLQYAQQAVLSPQARLSVMPNAQPSGPAPTATNAPVLSSNFQPRGTRADNAFDRTAMSDPAQDIAASRFAALNNQMDGHESIYRLNEQAVGDDRLAVAKPLSTKEANGDQAQVMPGQLAGAAGVVHIEPVKGNTGIPGPRDWEIHAQQGLANHAAYGGRDTVIEILPTGQVQIRPIGWTPSKMDRINLREQANAYQAHGGKY